MVAYIDNQYVENAIGSAEYNACTASTASVQTQLIASASSLVASVLENAGYSSSLTNASAPDIVKSATLGALLPMLYGRKGISVPEQFFIHMNALNGIRTGDLPITGMTPTARDAVGGVKFTDSSSTSTTGKPRIFGGLRKVY